MVSPLLGFLPYKSVDHVSLFSIYKNAAYVPIRHPLFIFPSSENKLIQTHSMQLKLQKIEIYINDALALAQPGWDAVIFFWPRKSPVGIPESPSR
jgi:hypothetical protein